MKKHQTYAWVNSEKKDKNEKGKTSSSDTTSVKKGMSYEEALDLCMGHL